MVNFLGDSLGNKLGKGCGTHLAVFPVSVRHKTSDAPRS